MDFSDISFSTSEKISLAIQALFGYHESELLAPAESNSAKSGEAYH